MEPTAVVALIVQGDKILVVTRYQPDLIALPGGNIDDGEEPAAAIIREVWEETGVIAHEAIPLYEGINESRWGKRVVRAFYMPNWSGEPTQRESRVEVYWADPVLLLNPIHSPYHAFTREVFIAAGILS
jgi:8-oxo-dGTP pyrophosphatase MutT (NUDIX family)